MRALCIARASEFWGSMRPRHIASPRNMRPQRRILALSTITPLTLLLALGGCSKKEEEKPAAAAGSAATGEQAKAAELPAEVAEKLAKAKVPGAERIAHDEGILGHFAFPSASKLLVDVREQLVTAQYQSFLDEAALRSLVSVALDKQGMVAQHMDLAQPMGCAIVDFKAWEKPVSCTFGYQGGVKALLEDLGETGRKPDAQGHSAIYELEGEEIYIDGLGNHVAVSGHGDLFEKTKGYLQADIIDRGGAMVGDVELIAYTGTIWSKYQEEIEGLMAELDGVSDTAPDETGNPKVDEAVKKWLDYNKASTKQSLDRLSQYDQVSAYFNVTKTGVRLGFTAIPTAGSEAEKDAKLAGGHLIDPAFVKAMPAGSLMVAAFNTDPRTLETAQVKEIRALAIDTWSDLAGLDKAEVTASVEAYVKESQGLLDGTGGIAVFDQEGATFAAIAVQRLKAGVSARDSWKAWSAKFTPEAVLGAEFSKYVTWEFKADASKSGDVAVDRWVIRPGAELQKELDKKLAEDPEAKALIDQYWGPVALTIDRAETNGNIIFAVAPKGEEAAMARAIAAQGGKGSLADDPGLAAVFGHSEALSGFMGFDVKATMDWLKKFPPVAEELKQVPVALGNDLSDLHMTSLYMPSGVMTFEYVLGQPMIEQIKGLIDKAG